MIKRIRQAMSQLFLEHERPMKIEGHDGECVSVGMADVHEIMRKCDCSESEAMDRLADWIVDRLEGKE